MRLKTLVRVFEKTRGAVAHTCRSARSAPGAAHRRF